jgi:hypothetical protein
VALIRRLIIILVALALAVLVTVFLLTPDSFSTIIGTLAQTSGFIRLPLAILIDVLVLVVLTVFLRSDRGQHRGDGLVVKAQGAVADVSVESVSDRILRAVRAVPDVLSAETNVKAVRGKADIDLSVVVSHQSMNLPDKQRELDRALRQVVNKQLGLQMAGKPRVHIRMDNEASLSKPLPALVEPVVVQKSEAKPEIKPEVKPEIKPEVKPEIQPETPKETLPRPTYLDTMSLRSTPNGEDKIETPNSDLPA